MENIGGRAPLPAFGASRPDEPAAKRIKLDPPDSSQAQVATQEPELNRRLKENSTVYKGKIHQQTIFEDDPTAILDEDYRTWIVNAAYLYDSIFDISLVWPTLSCQWLPEYHIDKESLKSHLKLLAGTQTDGSEQNYLMLFDVTLPYIDDDVELPADEKLEQKLGDPTWRFSKKIPHPSDVHRCQYCPAKTNIVATKSESGDVYLWDFDSAVSPSNQSNPDIPPASVLKGSVGTGFALQWSVQTPYYVASGGDDKVVCLWDCAPLTKEIQPATVLKGHSDSVQDVSFHCVNQDLIASASTDKTVRLWDIRKPGEAPVNVDSYPGEVTCVEFHHTDPNKFICGGTGNVIQNYDIRKATAPLHSMVGHDDDIMRLQWAPWSDTVVYSASSDKTSIVWDLSKVRFLFRRLDVQHRKIRNVK
jgi:histone-binding protein RBBP4